MIANDTVCTSEIKSRIAMVETKFNKMIFSRKRISRRPTGRPKTRWGDDIRKDIQKIKIPNWKTLA